MGNAKSKVGLGEPNPQQSSIEADIATFVQESERSENKQNKGDFNTPEDSLETEIFDDSGNLKPNIRYKTGEFEYFYETDSDGRISKFETDNLQLTERKSRLPHNSNTPGKIKGDHAGHIVGDRFGGSPDIDNLVSQASNVNLSKYKRIENHWAREIKKGKTVTVNIVVDYEKDSLRPKAFHIEYTIDGEYYEQDIINSN